MLLAAATRSPSVVKDDELNPNYIIPSVFHPDVAKAVAAAIRGERGVRRDLSASLQGSGGQHRSGRSLAGAHRAFDQPVHLGGALGAGPVDAAGRLP